MTPSEIRREIPLLKQGIAFVNAYKKHRKTVGAESWADMEVHMLNWRLKDLLSAKLKSHRRKKIHPPMQ